MKHTKGEWNDNGCGGVWRSGKNWKIADVKAGSGSADMRLILSAPELLEALKTLTTVTGEADALQHAGFDIPAKVWSAIYDANIKARAIISKAEGKQTNTQGD